MKYLYATAAVAVIGCGVLYLKQVRAAAYDRCYATLIRQAANKVSLGYLPEEGNYQKVQDKVLKDANSCANREMFR